MLDVHKYVVDDGVMFQPTAPAPPPVESSENWDDEDVESYKPEPKSHVIKKIKGATPSERRQMRCEGIRTYKPNQ
ncbi:hypothetical protein EVAR_22623_1 [Eumeta japonica]|uniref:Uncharacterized protein n=1 Tax=Eumeta variegata TaxID=151549 RepID=A0A4C1VKQ4_EUMVA|nr:hypothetical protein EVAR_22623_1 [Eumeta japonica]